MIPDLLSLDLAAPGLLAAAETSLFLDIDGTLAPLEATPDLVGPTPRRTMLLRRLNRRLEGRMAVLSGRDLAAIDRILNGAAPAAAGVHGLERRRADGVVLRPTPHPALADARRQAHALAAAHPGVLVEEKDLSIALHFRQAPSAEAAVVALARRLAQTGLALQPGLNVLELMTPGADKGHALRAFMSEPPFCGRRPVFVGDDLTDESAFKAADALGGYGVLVGAQRSTAARYRLAGVDQVLDWLERSLGDA